MTDSTIEATIRRLLVGRAAAIQRRDADAVTANAADDVVLFDALAGLRKIGKVDLQEKTAEWLGWYADLGFEMRELTVHAADDIAFAHYLYRVTGTMTDGTAVDMWVRDTVGLLRRDGDWAIVHEHTSVPFDADTGMALLNAQP